MTILLAAVAGLLAGRVLWLCLRLTFSSQAFIRANHRGVPVPTAVGIVLPMALLIVEAGRSVAGALGVGPIGGLSEVRLATVVVAIGFGLVGLLDDLVDDDGPRGFRGHLAALGEGRLTTGAVKMIGGTLVALVAVAPVAGESLARLLVDAAVVALAANLANLLDKAPGRAGKAGIFGFALVAVISRAASDLASAAVVAGAGAGLLLDDLHERLMLGDTGANVLGAVVGLSVVVTSKPQAIAVVAAVLGVLNVLSEVVSFSRIIESIKPLRAIDRAGRLDDV